MIIQIKKKKKKNGSSFKTIIFYATPSTSNPCTYCCEGNKEYSNPNSQPSPKMNPFFHTDNIASVA